MRTWRWAAAPGLIMLATASRGAEVAPAVDRRAVATVASDIVHEVKDRRLVLLGEKHGTREIPLLVGDLLDVWSRTGAVTLGLEIPRDEQPALDHYLASDGGPLAQATLRQSKFWAQARDDQHDGRRSHDMLALIERMRVLREAGCNIRVLAYDRASSDPMDHHARDRAMAARVATSHQVGGAGSRTVVLAGNVHAMRHRPALAPQEMQHPMGWHLRELQPFSIDVVAPTGYFWACVGGHCGPRASIAPPRSQRLQGEEFDYLAVLPIFTVARLLGRR